jgi:WD40 repeat protein
MSKKSLIWLAVILSIVLSLVIACGTDTSTNSVQGPVLPLGEHLYVLDGYAPGTTGQSGQRIVVFHPGNSSEEMTLPDGLTSLDHRVLVTASMQGSQAGQAGHTTISIYNTQNGALVRSLSIAGAYTTAGREFNDAVLSGDGRWLALRLLSSSTSATTIALVDTQAGKLVKTIHLNGDFDLDALSIDGSSLYLLERLHDGSGHYYVRLYNISAHQVNQMYQAPIVDKSELNDPNMTGTAIVRQGASNGSEVYTLYTDTYHHLAFVHILPLDPGFPFARCINLPAGTNPDLLRYYTLVLSADGSTLYAANAALGVVVEISLNPQSDDIYNDQIVATARFSPSATTLTPEEQARVLRNGAALTSDQSTLYFAGPDGIWSVKTGDLGAKHPTFTHLLAGQPITGVALSADNRTIYAVNPARGITMLNAITGQAEQVIQGPAHNPWSIEWITN